MEQWQAVSKATLSHDDADAMNIPYLLDERWMKWTKPALKSSRCLVWSGIQELLNKG